MPHVAKRLELRTHLTETQRTMLLMNLHGISSAQRYVGPTFAGQMDEIAFAAGAAISARRLRTKFRGFISPDIPRQ